jgi:CRISPR-associated Csx3 family protein
MSAITIDIEILYGDYETAKLADLPVYENKAKALAGSGNEVTLTGRGPIWLYLRIAHALHGVVRKLSYNSPVTGVVVIYDHSPN